MPFIIRRICYDPHGLSGVLLYVNRCFSLICTGTVQFLIFCKIIVDPSFSWVMHLIAADRPYGYLLPHGYLPDSDLAMDLVSHNRKTGSSHMHMQVLPLHSVAVLLQVPLLSFRHSLTVPEIPHSLLMLHLLHGVHHNRPL